MCSDCKEKVLFDPLYYPDTLVNPDTCLGFKSIYQMLYSFQCHQLTALMDVAYVGLIQSKPVILHRRNMTVGIGCGCKEMQIQRRQQVTGIVDE